MPEENVLGRGAKGFKIAMFALDQGRFTVAAGATGLIRACRDASVALREGAQDVRRRDRAAPAREGDDRADGIGLSGGASCWLRAAGSRTGAAQHARDGAREMVRDGRRPERAAGDAVQVHGANGYSDEYPVGRFYRNCKGAVIYEGTREIHKLMQADYLLGYRVDRPTRCELPAHDRNRRNLAAPDSSLHVGQLIFHSNFCGSSNRRPLPAPTRWGRAIGTSPTRSPSRRCAA